MTNIEAEADQQITYWVKGFQARPVQKWSLHIPFYYPKDGGRISPELLASVMLELQPMTREFFSTRLPVGTTRDPKTGETARNAVLAVQTLITDPSAEQVIPEWAKRNGKLLGQERALFIYQQPVWVITEETRSRE